MPDIFGGAAMENSDDLLNQALYLDAMEKLDNDHNDQTAPQELAKITPGSRFYDLAQEQLERLNQLRQETEKQEPATESDAGTGNATEAGAGSGTNSGTGAAASTGSGTNSTEPGANAGTDPESKAGDSKTGQ